MHEPGEITSPPESRFNKTLIHILKNIDGVLKRTGESPLHIAKETVTMQNNGKNIVTITDGDIVIAGHSFQKELSNKSSQTDSSDMSIRLKHFLDEIQDGILLDHMGISYFCGNIDGEKMRIKNIMADKSFPLQEEPTTEDDQAWLFLGNPNNNDPLFEFVLNKGTQIPDDSWRPHFQIDINTSLSIEEIRNLTDKHLGEGFVQWELDIPDVGTVLAMGVVGQINGTKLALGIGTNKRSTVFVRENTFKSI